MAYAIDRRDRMFNASNLNDLYARFDRKCFLALNGLSPLFGTNLGLNYYSLNVPYGVVYQYRRDPATCRRLAGPDAYLENYDQAKAYEELSKLENAFLDVSGGQVYVDKYLPSDPPVTIDVKQIHFSFELLKRRVDDRDYDVHLGWDPPTSAQTSYINNSLGSSPRFPPSRIHKHETAVADIYIEGFSEFTIKNTYQRYDCWRVHNCNQSVLNVFLQKPDQSSITIQIEPSSCRSFRRDSSGNWVTSWSNGNPCRYFFPYFSRDVPFFAGGPPSSTAGTFMAIERSASANNIANPFILFKWQAALFAQLDPDLRFNILSTYRGSYKDPIKDSELIGDCVFTWGRAKVVEVINGVVSRDFFKTFTSTATLVDDLEDIGIAVTKSHGLLSLIPKTNNASIAIYPVDANVFVGGTTNPYWLIPSTGTSVSTFYPASYSTENHAATIGWLTNNDPDFFDSISVLRRRIAVEEGYLSSYDDITEVSDSIVSPFTLTPAGLCCKAVTGLPIQTWDTYAFDEVENYERRASAGTLFIQERSAGEAPPASGFSGTKYISGIRTYLFQVLSSSLYYEKILPVFTESSFSGINAAFVPPNGPWGFASSVYDANLSRVLSVSTGGQDFWINKWGASNGRDAKVRILGQPDQTLQRPIQTTTETPALIPDDVFPDLNNPQMAGLVGVITLGNDFNLSQINYRDTNQYFNIPYTPSFVTQSGGTGPIFHKIPKSAWLWNLLEWAVSSWTRAIPVCMGNENVPLIGGVPLISVISTYDLDSSDESGRRAFSISQAQHDQLLTSGIPAYRQQLPPPFPIGTFNYWVASEDLASYCKSYGFNSYNFDTVDDFFAPTRRFEERSYSAGEKTMVSSYVDSASFGPSVSKLLYGSIRYVDLTS